MFARGASSIGATITSQSLDPVTSDVVGQAEFRSDNAGTVQIINRAVNGATDTQFYNFNRDGT
ncbi:TPA: hypothetical protein ACWXSL_005121, partial [Escherichia coli]